MTGGAASVLAARQSQQQSPTIPGTAVFEWIVEICYTHVLEDYATVVIEAPTRDLAIRAAERHVYKERSSEDSPAAQLTITQRYAERRRPRFALRHE